MYHRKVINAVLLEEAVQCITIKFFCPTFSIA